MLAREKRAASHADSTNNKLERDAEYCSLPGGNVLIAAFIVTSSIYIKMTN